MPPIKEVTDLLEKIRTIHERKNEDYAAPGKQFENFERASTLIAWFNSDADKTFVNHIATKLARLATLLNSNNAPNNESIEDSFLDLATYCILWGSFHKSNQMKQPRWEQGVHCDHDFATDLFGQFKQCIKCKITLSLVPVNP